jgi:hypothetical protein
MLVRPIGGSANRRFADFRPVLSGFPERTKKHFTLPEAQNVHTTRDSNDFSAWAAVNK